MYMQDNNSVCKTKYEFYPRRPLIPVCVCMCVYIHICVCLFMGTNVCRCSCLRVCVCVCALTIRAQHNRRGGAEGRGVVHGVPHHTGVVAHI